MRTIPPLEACSFGLVQLLFLCTTVPVAKYSYGSFGYMNCSCVLGQLLFHFGPGTQEGLLVT
jgi:hypothetical protein